MEMTIRSYLVNLIYLFVGDDLQFISLPAMMLFPSSVTTSHEELESPGLIRDTSPLQVDQIYMT